MKYFFDSYAIIEIIKNNPNYEKFKEEVIITNAFNIAEVHYFFMENASEIESDRIIRELNIELLQIDREAAIQASKMRFKNKRLKLSYADCLGYVTSQKNNIMFLTGDDAFKEMENVEFVK